MKNTVLHPLLQSAYCASIDGRFTRTEDPQSDVQKSPLHAEDAQTTAGNSQSGSGNSQPCSGVRSSTGSFQCASRDHQTGTEYPQANTGYFRFSADGCPSGTENPGVNSKDADGKNSRADGRTAAGNSPVCDERYGAGYGQRLFDPAHEHDACGVGFVAKIDGTAQHAVIEHAVTALARMQHRGGSGCGFGTADGAGLLVPIPKQFMSRVWEPICGSVPDSYGIAHLFMPASESRRTAVEAVVEQTCAAHGLKVAGWRDTPTRPEMLQARSRVKMPCIRQALIVKEASETASGTEDGEAFERLLYVVRRHMEKAVVDLCGCGPDDFYAVSFSSRSIVYKGMLRGGDLAAFYPDLACRDFTVCFAVFHERFSTNTDPSWRLAQPFHCMAHNGEINTIHSNRNFMRMRESLLSSPYFGENVRHLIPVLDERGSDSAMLDNALELLQRSGRTLAHSAMMLMPEPFGGKFIMGEDKRAFYEFHAALMEPWDGPSAVVFSDGCRQVGAMLDRNALRPCRYVVTKDGLMLLASEAGVLDIPSSRIARLGRLQPRRMLLVDFARKRIVTDAECKNRVIYDKPYRSWIHRNNARLRDLPLPASHEHERLSGATLLRQQHLYGFSQEDITSVLLPMAKTGEEPVFSMGLDTPLAVLSKRPQLLFDYLKQRFAQVTNPPIDSLRENLVMTLTVFAGRRNNLLEETAEHYSLLRMDSPVLLPEDMQRLRHSRHPSVRVACVPMVFRQAPLPSETLLPELPASEPPQPEQWVSERQASGKSASGKPVPVKRVSGTLSSRTAVRKLSEHSDCPGQWLAKGLDAMCAAADDAIQNGATIIVLSDATADAANVPIPSLLAVSALQRHLLRTGQSHLCGVIVDTGEVKNSMHMAQLIAFGASAVHPRVALASIDSLAREKKTGGSHDLSEARAAYISALHKGLLKTLSRMGISTLRSFCGGRAFEAVGLGAELVERYFSGLPSRIGGIGLDSLAADALSRHTMAFPGGQDAPAGLVNAGKFKNRRGGEKHLWSATAIRALHKAVRNSDAEAYAIYANESDEQRFAPVTLRGLLQFRRAAGIPLEMVESSESIMRRFVGAAMSFGSISKEAHEAIAIGLNRVGGRSNCGEGGELSERVRALPNGDSKRSRIRQIASGRFGVTAAYLAQADEIQIKMAQGAKPGEGGQLPAHKVLPEIARVRGTLPGITLISPPPHHDIYSIEDLAQLIYDLKRLRPGVRVSVKLVAGTNVGTIASGVVKAGADSILISGHDGGTGAASCTAIASVGLPWELGLAETHHALVHNRLRGMVSLQTDGQLRTGRDLAIAALLGAEEFGFGTSLLVALGCCMLRDCHLGTCATGIAAQDERLRARQKGTADHVEAFLRFLAGDLRRHMAALGFCTVQEMIGRADMLEVASVPSLSEVLERDPSLNETDARNWLRKIGGLNFEGIIQPAGIELGEMERERPVADPFADTELEKNMLEHLLSAVRSGKPARFEARVFNVNRSVCARLAGEIARQYGEHGLPPGTIMVVLRGTAGQSAGAFLTSGVNLLIHGAANDYAGKGLSGGLIAVIPDMEEAGLYPEEKAAIGNVALYGATSGELYVGGSAGERFAVRNSGAQAVVEGVGDHACEYMTGGVVVVLGLTGYNFAAGMSGGTAFVYDRSETFQNRCNMDSIDIASVWKAEDQHRLRALLERHRRYTGSKLVSLILNDWQAQLPLFLKITPAARQNHVPCPRDEDEAAHAGCAAGNDADWIAG